MSSSPCDVVVSACHLPLDFGSKNPSPFVGRRFCPRRRGFRFANDPQCSLYYYYYHHQLPQNSTASVPPLNNIICRGGIFSVVFFRFFLLISFFAPNNRPRWHHSGVPICNRRGRLYEFRSLYILEHWFPKTVNPECHPPRSLTCSTYIIFKKKK